MNDFVIAFLGFVVVCLAILVGSSVGVLVGALSGAIVTWVGLGSWVSAGAAAIGLTILPTQLWQLGAFLGFIGGFFRASTTIKEK